MTIRRSRTYAHHVLAIALASCWTATATAQEGPVPAAPADASQAEDAAPGEDIVVTGSLIAGTRQDDAQPVDVYGAEDIQKSGISSSVEFLKQLPSVGSVNGDTNLARAPGQQALGTINLRNLGAERNLVLLNGKRTITAPGTGFTDTNLIPMFALARVEVLKDGAAATYGSDAISGVANFITRRNFDGLELQGNYTWIKGSNGDYQLSALFGRKFENGSFMIGVGHQVRSQLQITDRDFTQQPVSVNSQRWSRLGNPGTYNTRLGDISQGRNGAIITRALDGSAIGACQATGGTLGTSSGAPVCLLAADFGNLVEPEQRWQVYAQADADLSSDFRLHAEALYAQTIQSDIRYPPNFSPVQGPLGPGLANGFFVPSSNPGYRAFITQSGLAGTAADPFTAGTPANLQGSYASILSFVPNGNGGADELFGGTGGASANARNSAFRVSGGVEWDISSALKFRGDLTYFDARRKVTVPDIVSQRLQAALEGFGGASCNRATGTAGVGNCLYFNPFINSQPRNPAQGLTNPGFVAGNANSREVLDYLYQPTGNALRQSAFIADGVISGDTGIELGGGSVKFAIGGQFRSVSYTTDPINALSNAEISPCPIAGQLTCQFPVGPFLLLQPSLEGRFSQQVYAAFAEVAVPIFETLEVTGAIRFEDYGGGVGSTLNPKGSVRWQVADFLTLRGSASTTFRGPPPNLVGRGRIGGPLLQMEAIGGNFRPTDNFGNPNVKPETAFTFNIGAVVNTGGFSASVDYWSYDFKDALTNTPPQGVANAVGNGPGSGAQLVNCSHPLAYLITFTGNNCVQGVTTANEIQRIRTDVTNGPGIKTSGIDFGINYVTGLGSGRLTLGLEGSYVLRYDVSPFTVGGVQFLRGFKAVGFSNFDRGAPSISRLKGNLFANYAMDWVNLRYVMDYVSGTRDNRGPIDTGAGISNFGVAPSDFVRHNIVGVFDLPFDFAKVQLTVGVDNITDEDPPAARLELGYNAFVGDPLGRTYKLGLRVGF